jgi:methionyl-tRNA formyltransferase
MSVITETAKPSGRGRELAEPLIKKIAQDNKIAVFQPEDKVELTEIIEQIKPDLLILASYGKILPAQALESAVYGCLNVHPSILPKFRGATPIQSTILAGEKTTGVTVMEMAAQVDAGGIVSQEKVSLTGSETSPVLRERLAKLGASQLIKALPIFLSGQAKIIAQKEADVTSTKKLTKEMGEIDWSLPVEQIDRQIRALDPWPGTYTTLGEKRLKIVSAKLNSGKLELETVQLEGKNVANWQDFKRGYAKQLTNEVWFSKIV